MKKKTKSKKAPLPQGQGTWPQTQQANQPTHDFDYYWIMESQNDIKSQTSISMQNIVNGQYFKTFGLLHDYPKHNQATFLLDKFVDDNASDSFHSATSNKEFIGYHPPGWIINTIPAQPEVSHHWQSTQPMTHYGDQVAKSETGSCSSHPTEALLAIRSHPAEPHSRDQVAEPVTGSQSSHLAGALSATRSCSAEPSPLHKMGTVSSSYVSRVADSIMLISTHLYSVVADLRPTWTDCN